jgi:hypothetical protein
MHGKDLEFFVIEKEKMQYGTIIYLLFGFNLYRVIISKMVRWL